MINLLPMERKRDFRAARTNIILLRYNLMTIAAIAILAAFCLAFYAILHTNQAKAFSTADDNNKKVASLSGVQQAANDYRSDLTYAKAIIGNSTSYTDVVIAITKLMPDGAILDSLNLSSTSFGQQTQFQAHVKSYAVGEQVKQNFQSSKLYSNVYFNTLGYDLGSKTPISIQYPVVVSMSAKFNGQGSFQ
ncbi:MAG: hypothetical protein JWO07_295 [Candidatus Saccharibacteria bacterium]|nr:hypothetical protein [Candidatus Saccharibacteria bacterium]